MHAGTVWRLPAPRACVHTVDHTVPRLPLMRVHHRFGFTGLPRQQQTLTHMFSMRQPPSAVRLSSKLGYWLICVQRRSRLGMRAEERLGCRCRTLPRGLLDGMAPTELATSP